MGIQKMENTEAIDECKDFYIREDKHWGGDLDVIRKYVEKFCELSILDVGVGYAWHLANLLFIIPSSVRITRTIGLDYSEKMLQKAAEFLASFCPGGRCAREHMQLKHGDILSLPFERDSFDVVLCLNNTLGNISGGEFKDAAINRCKALKEINRVLRVGGYIILSVYNADRFASKHSYGNVFELDPSLSSLDSFDFVIRVKNKDVLFYSHWFNDQEITTLLRDTCFDLSEVEHRQKRIVVVAQKVRMSPE